MLVLSALLSFIWKKTHVRERFLSPASVTLYPMTMFYLFQGTQQELTVSGSLTSLSHYKVFTELVLCQALF